MKPMPLLMMIVLSVCALGYIELRYQAERAALRSEVARLEGRVRDAEKLASERGETLSGLTQERQDWKKGAAELSALETRLLDKAAELALLESDRAVAEERTAKALDNFKEQVRSFATIEADVATLSRRRERLKRQVAMIERRVERAELGAAERQKLAEQLDREIAGLAIRHETLRARMAEAERAQAERALSEVARVMPEKNGAEAPILADVAPGDDGTRPPPDPSPALEPLPAMAPADIEDDPVPAAQGQERGLYRFGRLSAEPAVIEEDQPVEPEQTARDWAEDQYSLGLKLVSDAERTSGTRKLSDAVLAFKAVLGEWPKERDRMRWAIARSDLGYALALLGRRQGRADVLEEAVGASRDALREFTSDRAPMLWAAAKHHLGVSLAGLAEVRDDVDLWKESIQSLEASIAAFKGAGASEDAKKVEVRLREAYAHLPTDLPPPSE